jgi:RNA polymerase sigma-70 factor (ECF subfamily)
MRSGRIAYNGSNILLNQWPGILSLTRTRTPRTASQIMDIDVPSEPELLQRARLFEHPALAQIYDVYSPGLYRYAMRLLGDQNLAEDCVSDTFARFLQALQANHGPENFLQAYLYRMAHNWISDYYRREPAPAEELTEEHRDDRAGPEEDTNRRQRQERLRAALQQLTPDQQQVIALKCLDGWENEEIARSLKKPVGAVKSLQHRALATLQRVLQTEDFI